MKKLILIFMMIFLNGEELAIQKGWNLLGATSNLNIKKFDNSCGKIIWKYKNKEWNLYIPNQTNKTKYKTIDKIEKGEGFWVYGDKNCTIKWEKWFVPKPNTTFQWQLTGDLNLSYDVNLYDIDLFDTNISTIQKLHKEGKKVICYFSAGSYEDWREDKNKFPSSVLGNNLDGWGGEKWLDISKIDILKPIMTNRLDLAVKKGCDGVEPDNVDGYSNDTGFSLTFENQLNYNKMLAEEAHKRGLSIALKNDLSQIKQLEPYFDFAINEQCHQYNECSLLTPFIKNNKAVFNIEYNSKYLDDDNLTILCNQANENNFTTLVLPKNLDDSFRIDCKNYLFKSFRVGYGGGDAFKFYNNKWINTTDLMFKEFNNSSFQKLSSYLKKGKYFSIWITKGWKKEWINLKKVQEAMDKGKIPVFIYFWFGDKMMYGISDEDIENYLKDVKKLKEFLDVLKGEHFLILEPEFNKNNIIEDKTQQNKFIEVMDKAIDILKKEDRKLSLCMMDTGNRGVDLKYSKCGYENCALGDKYEWSKSFPIYDKLIKKLDFISFQEMIAQFSRDPANPGSWDKPNPKSFTDKETGINYLDKRIDNFALFLKKRYNKPVFLPYIAIATATWNDKNGDGKIDKSEINPDGWIEKAENVYKNLNSKNLFGYAVMELFDNPTHDKGGYQYFMENEYHLGIVGGEIKDNQLTEKLKFKGKILEYIFGE